MRPGVFTVQPMTGCWFWEELYQSWLVSAKGFKR